MHLGGIIVSGDKKKEHERTCTCNKCKACINALGQTHGLLALTSALASGIPLEQLISREAPAMAKP